METKLALNELNIFGQEEEQRPLKSYADGNKMMKRGRPNEIVLMRWLGMDGKKVIDCRDFREAQEGDYDCRIIDSVDGSLVLAELKSDQYVKDWGNLCFENNRINHFVTDHWFYLGWGWRSVAEKLIVRNPDRGDTYVFKFATLRPFIGQYVAKKGRDLNVAVIPTDDQKTTINFLIPIRKLAGLYEKFIVEPPVGVAQSEGGNQWKR